MFSTTRIWARGLLSKKVTNDSWNSPSSALLERPRPLGVSRDERDDCLAQLCTYCCVPRVSSVLFPEKGFECRRGIQVERCYLMLRRACFSIPRQHQAGMPREANGIIIVSFCSKSIICIQIPAMYAFRASCTDEKQTVRAGPGKNGAILRDLNPRFWRQVSRLWNDEEDK